MPGDGGQPGGGFGVFAELTTFYTHLDGTTLMGEYEVVGGAVLLSSADFGEASAELDGQAPEAVAIRLLLQMAHMAMAQPGERYMRDDEVNTLDARSSEP